MVTRTVVALVVASGLFLSGCDGGDGPAADPSGSPASSPSAAASSAGSATSASGAQAPATGPLVEDDDVAYRLPEGVEWRLARGGFSATAYDDDLNALHVGATVVPLQAGETGDDLDADYASSVGDLPYDPPLERGPDRVVGGVEGWTAETVAKGQLVYAFGALHDRVAFDVIFEFPKKDPHARERIEAVLASIQWK